MRLFKNLYKLLNSVLIGENVNIELEEKPKLKILKHIQSDIAIMKQKIIVIEEEIDAISEDMHEVRPEYIKKLQKIEQEGRFHSFKSIDELKKAIEAQS